MPKHQKVNIWKAIKLKFGFNLGPLNFGQEGGGALNQSSPCSARRALSAHALLVALRPTLQKLKFLPSPALISQCA